MTDAGPVLRVSLSGEEPGRVVYDVDGSPVWFATPGHPLATSGAAALALGFLPALQQGRALEVDLDVSPRLLAALPELQSIFGTWRGRTPIEVTARPGDVRPPRAPGVGCFFSGGVDSFHSALRHRDELTHLIFVHGFDIALDDDVLAGQALGHARAAAASLGLDLVEVTTNLRRHAPLSQGWLFAHGPAAFAVAHSLAAVVGTVYVPASWTYTDARPQGTHPLTDRLWSSENVGFVHDGADTTRFAKVGELARYHRDGSGMAAQHLRVCWENRGGAYNCSVCEKCVRTMVALRAHGALDRFITFRSDVDLLDLLRRAPVEGEVARAFTEQTLAELERSGRDEELAAVLRRQLRPPALRALAGRARRALRRELGRTRAAGSRRRA